MSETAKQEPAQKIPAGIRPHFQEYDPDRLDLERDANLVIQRTLEYGNWEETRWLFRLYRKNRICRFVQEYGERGLSPVVFNYWRKLFGIRKWRKAPFSETRTQLWKR